MWIAKDKVKILIMTQRPGEPQFSRHKTQDIRLPILTLELANIEFELAAGYPVLVKSSLLCEGTNAGKWLQQLQRRDNTDICGVLSATYRFITRSVQKIVQCLWVSRGEEKGKCCYLILYPFCLWWKVKGLWARLKSCLCSRRDSLTVGALLLSWCCSISYSHSWLPPSIC